MTALYITLVICIAILAFKLGYDYAIQREKKRFIKTYHSIYSYITEEFENTAAKPEEFISGAKQCANTFADMFVKKRVTKLKRTEKENKK